MLQRKPCDSLFVAVEGVFTELYVCFSRKRLKSCSNLRRGERPLTKIATGRELCRNSAELKFGGTGAA